MRCMTKGCNQLDASVDVEWIVWSLWGNETHHPPFLEVFRKNSEMSWPILWRHGLDWRRNCRRKQPLQTCREWICMSSIWSFLFIGFLLKRCPLLIFGSPSIRDISNCIPTAFTNGRQRSAAQAGNVQKDGSQTTVVCQSQAQGAPLSCRQAATVGGYQYSGAYRAPFWASI